MIAIEVYAEAKDTRTHVGTLTRNDRGYFFCYANSWLENSRAIEIGPDLPLSSEKKSAKIMPESFRARIPSRSSANYEQYCLERGLDPAESDEMILLGNIGQKGASSFVFELSDEVEREKAVAKRLNELLELLSLREAAVFFGLSHTTIAKIRNAVEEKGPGYRYVEAVLLVEEAFFHCLRVSLGITEQTRQVLKDLAKSWKGQRVSLEQIEEALKLNPRDKSARKNLAKWNYIRTGPRMDLARSRTQEQKALWEKLMKKYGVPLKNRSNNGD